MLRCRELEQKHRARNPKFPRDAREAVLAATTVHLLPGDQISAAPGDLVAQQLQPAPKAKLPSPGVPPSPTLSRLALAAATAHGLRAAGTDNLVLAFARAGAAEHGWAAALEWAHLNQFPLLLACTDASFTASAKIPAKDALTWHAISRLAARIKLPVLPVDGEDAVAVYRAMQESVIRARYGGGPAVLWTILSPLSAAKPSLPRNLQPIARLNSYLKARKIVLPK